MLFLMEERMFIAQNIKCTNLYLYILIFSVNALKKKKYKSPRVVWCDISKAFQVIWSTWPFLAQVQEEWWFNKAAAMVSSKVVNLPYVRAEHWKHKSYLKFSLASWWFRVCLISI